MSRWRLLLILVGAALLAAGCALPSTTTVVTGSSTGGTEWDAGNIISDAIFYNSASMTVAQVQTFLDSVGPGCDSPDCLRSLIMDTPPMTSPWCSAFPGGHMPFAQMLVGVSQACGINPQVILVLIQKESQGLTRVPPAALTGFGCPDTGPGGSANCDASKAGVFAQTYGAVQSFSHAHKDSSAVQRYIEGPTPHEIFWNVEETGCGAGLVTVANRATATLYTYTPYQPNQAALDAYPGTGDACSAYGNRNFFRMFQGYFGTTGGGKVGAGAGLGGSPGFTQNPSQDPSSFGWVRAGAMVPYSFQGHNFGSVAKGTERLWDALFTDLVPLIPGGLNSDLGCFEDRNNVNNPSVASFHAYGLACDLNTGVNCNGCAAAGLQGQQFALPMETSSIAAKWGFEWGGDFHGTPDPMHLELHLSPGQVAQFVNGGSTPAA